MASTNERLISPNDVIVDEITITSITGVRYDLTKVMVELNIYEDLFSNGMTGNIVITDWLNLFNLVPIVGQEKIEIDFHTPVLDESKKLTFQVYKTSARVLDKERTQIYMLHFASVPTIKNSLTKLSKTYTGTISNIVNDIVFDDLESEFESIFTSSGTYRFVIPSWTPFKAINFMAKKAKSTAGKDTSFLLYEDRDGFHFFPVSQMLADPNREIENTYVFAPFQKTGNDLLKEGERDIEANFFAIKEYKILDSMDTLRAIRSGMFASRLISYDMTSKKISNSTFNYLDSFKDFSHVQDKGTSNPLTVDIENPNGFKYHDFQDSNIQRFDTHDGQYSDITTPQNPEEYILQRQSLFEQLMMHRMKIVIPGNSTLKIGDVMPITLPSPEHMHEEFKPDNMVTGKYLITSIRHKIQKGNYENVIELSKNSFFEPLPEKTSLETP